MVKSKFVHMTRHQMCLFVWPVVAYLILVCAWLSFSLMLAGERKAKLRFKVGLPQKCTMSYFSMNYSTVRVGFGVNVSVNL